MSVRHVVIWSFLDDIADPETTFQEMAIKLQGLVGVIPGLTSLEVGRDLGDSEANWDVVLVSEHDSVQALEVYQQHPAHLEVAAWVRKNVASKAAVDYSY
jgi:hypothetical protein